MMYVLSPQYYFLIKKMQIKNKTSSQEVLCQENLDFQKQCVDLPVEGRGEL